MRPRLATIALFLATGLSVGTWAGALPTLQQQLGLSDAMLSIPLAGFAAGAITSMTVAPRLAARFSVDRTAAVAAFALAAALLVPSRVHGLPALVAAAVLLGLSSGLLDLCMNSKASLVEQAWGAPLMSSFHALFSLGGMVGALGISVTLRLGLGLGEGMGLAAGLTGALAAGALLLDRGRGPTPVDTAAADAKWRRWDPAVTRIAALTFLAMLIEGAIADWSGVFMSQVTGVSAAIAATGYAAFAVAMVAGRVIGDRIVEALGPARILRIGAVTVGIAVLVTVALPQPDIARLCFAIAGLGLSNLVPVLFSTGARIKPDRPEEGVAGAAVGGYAGFLLGPIIIGLLSHVVDLRLALLLLAAAAAVLAASAPNLVASPAPEAV